MEEYKKYIRVRPNSFLPRMLGLYRIANEDRYFITHKNLFGCSREVQQQYLWNPNTISSITKLSLGFLRKSELLEQIEQDVIVSNFVYFLIRDD
jgi:hypothetical protein